ncbi:MAG: ATP-binding protein [Tepidisphaeraceae bacterium]|jgi:two-component system phosphate regulon sensor histidine kinase PhoR
MQGRVLLRLLLTLVGVTGVVGAAVAAAAGAPPQWRTPSMLAVYTVAAALILVLAAARVRRSRWVMPVRRMETAAARMARGEWDVRVQPHGSTGAQSLAVNLNQLAAQAYKQLSDLQHQRAGLQALVDTLPDPILAAGPTGRITLINAPAARLLSLQPQQALEQKLVNVVNDEQIVELYEALVGAGGARASGPATILNYEIRLVRNGQRSTYQAVATRAPGGGALLVLRDVTGLAGAMQMKTDFVANASHELRTPIAAIKIAFETLREVYLEDPAQSERCITVIDGHLRRLEEMLRDLLDLSRVESADLKPRVVAVKTSELYAGVRSTMGVMARQKNVELRLGDGDAGTGAAAGTNAASEFRTDTRLVYLVLKNLVENSIKFTPSGGRVTVSFQQSPPPVSGAGGTVTLTVADTGIGIAPEHIERVFERFYQVDAARSGSAGRGTGLGLAIVKHAVHALGGTVRLQSAVGAGTTVTCEFPQTNARQTEHDPEPTAA